MDVSATWLHDQHQELDHALAEVEFLAERRAFQAATKRFKDFEQRLLEHMSQEETDERLARVAKAHHAQLATVLESVASALRQGDYAEFCYGVNALGKMLTAHQRAEENACQ